MGWNGVTDCEVLELVPHRCLVYTWDASGEQARDGTEDDRDLDTDAAWRWHPCAHGALGLQASRRRPVIAAMSGGWPRILERLDDIAARFLRARCGHGNPEEKDGPMNEHATETLSVVVEREIPYPPEKIWRALTQPHLIEEWLMKNDFKPVVGHRFNLRADWGAVDCQVLAVEPNKTLSYTWAAYGSRECRHLDSHPDERGHPPAHGAVGLPAGSAARPTRAPRAGGSSSLRPWSRSWRG